MPKKNEDVPEKKERNRKNREELNQVKKNLVSKLFHRMESDMKRIEKISKKLDVNSIDRLDFIFSQFSEKIERIRTGFKTREDESEEIIDIFSV